MTFYTKSHRTLQHERNSTSIAERLLETRCHDQLNSDDHAIIAAAPFFFLATADTQGRPDCSYKGGDPGFVRILDPKCLVFPDYDGNGMFRTLGNIAENPHVGMLFMQLSGEMRRLRLNGVASLSADPTLVDSYPGATSVVRVVPQFIFPNCPRYVHTFRLEQLSEYTPRENYDPPAPAWKSKPDLKDYVPQHARRPKER